MTTERNDFATRSLLIQMISEGVNQRQLADRCGVDIRLIQNQLASNFPSQRARFRVENALKIPIWSTLEEFKRAAEIAQLFGFDPRLANFSTLKDFARQQGIEPDQRYSKPALVRKIARKLSKTKPQTQIHP